MVTVAVGPALTTETTVGIVGSATPDPNVLQNDLGPPSEWPKSM